MGTLKPCAVADLLGSTFPTKVAASTGSPNIASPASSAPVRPATVFIGFFASVLPSLRRALTPSLPAPKALRPPPTKGTPYKPSNKLPPADDKPDAA